jgi:hypothetical protein
MRATIPDGFLDCEAVARILDSTAMSDDESTPPQPHHDARARLVWELLVFHLKLAAEAIRDIFLSPVSIIAVFVGLIAGGDKPDLYFRRVQRFGRRSDLWINVFGARHRGPSADEIVRPIEESLLAQTRRGGRFERGASHVNQLLDAVNKKNVKPRDEEH